MVSSQKSCLPSSAPLFSSDDDEGSKRMAPWNEAIRLNLRPPGSPCFPFFSPAELACSECKWHHLDEVKVIIQLTRSFIAEKEGKPGGRGRCPPGTQHRVSLAAAKVEKHDQQIIRGPTYSLFSLMKRTFFRVNIFVVKNHLSKVWQYLRLLFFFC